MVQKMLKHYFGCLSIFDIELDYLSKLLWVNRNLANKSNTIVNPIANRPHVSSEVFGTTEKLNKPVCEVVKNLYSCKFNEGTNLIQLLFTLPSITTDARYIALDTPVEMVVCFKIIDINIARAI